METVDFFSFLDGIHSSYIGFGGGAFFFLLFLLINYKRANLFVLILSGGAIYMLSIGIGVATYEILQDRTGAFVAGFWAPLLFFSGATFWIRTSKAKEKASDYDHLIDNNNH